MAINTALYSSATDQHNTPRWLVGRVRTFLLGIDLDPCTSPANPTGAQRFFTVEDDGLAQEWSAETIYMNPPYGRDIGKWTKKLVGEFYADHFTTALALLPARVDTRWWADLAAFPVCFIRGRLRFNDCDQSAPFPSALVYLGWDNERFATHFAPQFGLTYFPATKEKLR